MKYLETIAYNNTTPGTGAKTFFDIRHKSYLIQYINTQEERIEKTIFGYILEDDEGISELYMSMILDVDVRLFLMKMKKDQLKCWLKE